MNQFLLSNTFIINENIQRIVWVRFVGSLSAVCRACVNVLKANRLAVCLKRTRDECGGGDDEIEVSDGELYVFNCHTTLPLTLPSLEPLTQHECGEILINDYSQLTFNNSTPQFSIIRLFFIALHNLLEISLHRHSFIRLGEYFVQQHSSLLSLSPTIDTSELYAISIKFFLIGRRIGFHVAVHKTHLQSLNYQDLQTTSDFPSQTLPVIVAPLAIFAQLKGIAENEFHTLQEWNNLLEVRNTANRLGGVLNSPVRLQVDNVACVVPACVVFKYNEIRGSSIRSLLWSSHSHHITPTYLTSHLPFIGQQEVSQQTEHFSAAEEVNFWHWYDPIPPSPTRTQPPIQSPQSTHSSQIRDRDSSLRSNSRHDSTLKFRSKSENTTTKHTKIQKNEPTRETAQENEENEKKRLVVSRESSEQKQVIDNEIPSDENVAKSKLAVGHKLGIVIDTTDLPSPTDVKPSLPVTPSHEFNRTKDYLNTEQNKENPTEKKETLAPVSGVGVTDPTSTSSASSVLPQPPTVPPPLPLRASTSGLELLEEVDVPDLSEWLEKMDTEPTTSRIETQNKVNKIEDKEQATNNTGNTLVSDNALPSQSSLPTFNVFSHNNDNNNNNNNNSSMTVSITQSPLQLPNDSAFPLFSTFFSSHAFIPSTYSSLVHTIRRPEVKWRPTYHPRRRIQTHNDNHMSILTNQSQIVVSSPAQNGSLPSNESDSENESESEEVSDTTDDFNSRFQILMNKEDATESPHCVMKTLSPVPSIHSFGDNEQKSLSDDSESSLGHQQPSEDIVAHILTHNQEISSAMAMILGQVLLTTRSLNTSNTSSWTFSRLSQNQQRPSSFSSFSHTLIPQNPSPYLQPITRHNPLLLEILQQQAISCYDMIEEDRHLKNFYTENLPLSDLMNFIGNSTISSPLMSFSRLHSKPLFFSQNPPNDVILSLLTSLKSVFNIFGQQVCGKRETLIDSVRDVIFGPLSLSQWAELPFFTQSEADISFAKQTLVEPLQESHLLVGRQDECFAIPSHLLFFWEKANFEPYSPRKHVLYFVVTPDNVSLIHHTTHFLNQLTTLYELCNLGRHQIAQTSKYPDGIVRISDVSPQVINEDDTSSVDSSTYTSSSLKSYHFTKYVTECRTLAQHLNEDPTLPVNAENTIVVYLVFPFEVTDHHSVLLYTCLTAMWEVLKRKSPPPTVKVVLQPLFIEHILRSTLSPDLIRALAFSVYTKIRRIPLRERHLLYEPAAILAPALNEDSTSSPAVCSTLHCCYLLSENAQCAALVCTDAQGEYLETRIIQPSSSSSSTTEPNLSAGIIRHIWSYITECFLPLFSESSTTKQFLLVIGRLGEFTASELDDWKAMFSSCGCMTIEDKQQPNLTLITDPTTPNAVINETNHDSNFHHHHHHHHHREFCAFNFISQIALVSLTHCRPLQLVSNYESESGSRASLSSASRSAWTLCSPLPINYGVDLRSPHVAYLFIPTPLFERDDDTNDGTLSSFHISFSEASPPLSVSLSYHALLLKLHQTETVDHLQNSNFQENKNMWTTSQLLRHISRQYHAFVILSVYFHLPKRSVSNIFPLPFHFLLAKRLLHLLNKLQRSSYSLSD